jgi:hypothetical protein
MKHLFLLVLLLTNIVVAQTIIAPVHAFAERMVSPNGRFLGYSSALCIGEIFPGYPFVVDVFDGHSGTHFGRYQGDWVVTPAPTYTFHLLTDGNFIDEFSGELVGSWTPFAQRKKTGQWYLQKDRTIPDVHAWFQDYQLASSSKLTYNHVLGCAGFDVIFGVLE